MTNKGNDICPFGYDVGESWYRPIRRDVESTNVWGDFRLMCSHNGYCVNRYMLKKLILQDHEYKHECLTARKIEIGYVLCLTDGNAGCLIL